MQSPTLNPELREFWTTQRMTDGTHVIGRVLYGGRMSSKSHDAAGVAIARSNFRTERFLCTRMYQNRIADSVYALLKDKISYFKLSDQFKIYADAIEHKYNDSLFRFYGIARNIDEIKSFEGATVWWNEESHNLTQPMFTTVRPTIMRNDGAEMWFTLNPHLASDYSFQRLIAKPPKGFLVHQINYDRNPFLNASALRDIEAEFEEDRDLAAHIYLGVPRSDDSKAIIKRSWIEAAVDAHEKLGIDLFGARCVGYDVADDGEDRNCVTVFDGGVAVELEAWKAGEDELRESALRAWGHVQGGRLVYDSIGIGAHTGSTLKASGAKRDYYKFNAGDAVAHPDREYAKNVTNKQKFENRKAQAWQDVADRLRNTFNAVTKGMSYPADQLISISSSIESLEELKTELSTPRRDYSSRGLDMVEKKKDIKKRLEGRSHDLADSFIMGACPHLADVEDRSVFDLEIDDDVDINYINDDDEIDFLIDNY
jgi:phage terminase large subunit